MRNPDRIGKILERLGILWNYYPDQRLGQLLSNYVFGRGDIFFPEDDETLKNINDKIKKLES